MIDPDSLEDLLWRAGFVAADEDAADLIAAAGGDQARLDALVARRLTGEPIAWITGRITFCGVELHIEPGVYVPRWQTEPLARRAAERLPAAGAALDVCTGSGAVAATLRAARPLARVVGTDIDARAVACAAVNGVEVYRGDLLAPVPPELVGAVDVLVAVVPYVPTSALPLLQRDTFAFESTLPYDGGPDGTGVLRRVAADGPRFLRPGGALLLELGGEQADAMAAELTRLGYVDVHVQHDDEGDVRSIEATLDTPPT